MADGQLGLGGIEDSIVTVPLRNKFMEQKDIKEVASGLLHAVLLLSDGSLYSMGSNVNGALGRDTGSEKRPGQHFCVNDILFLITSFFRISGCHGHTPGAARVVWS